MTKKRALCVGVLLAMVVSLLPMTALAGPGGKTVLKDVVINGIVSPVAGEEIPAFTCSGNTATASTGYKLTATSSQGPVSIARAFWGNAGSTSSTNSYPKTAPEYGNTDYSGDTFETGKSYFLWVLLGAYENDNVMFDLSEKLNSIKTTGTTGKLMEFALQVGKKDKFATTGATSPTDLEFDHGWSNSGMFTYTWVKLYFPAYTYIGDGLEYLNARVNATWPQEGKTPDFNVVSDDPAAYTATNVKWYPTDQPSKTLSASDKFLAGVGYTLEYTLKTVDPYTSFTSDLYVDGPTTDTAVSNLTDGSALCKNSFDPLDAIVTSVSLKGIKTPVAGQPKQTSGVTVDGKQCTVASVNVTGNFDSSGNYKAGETYTMRVEMNPNPGFTFLTDFNMSNVTVDNGIVDFAALTEFWTPYVQIKLTAPGDKDKIDKGTVTFDLSNGVYVVPDMSMGDSDALADTITWLSGENKIKVTADGYELNGSGVTDVILQTSAGTQTMRASDKTNLEGTVTLSLSPATISSQVPAGGAYYSAVVFKFPGGSTPGGVTPPDLSGKTNPFVDVSTSDYFYTPVLWAYYSNPQITVGTDATHFSPDKTVTRGQCVTFLWRAVGCPEPATTTNPFVDVDPSVYWYKPILWASEKGITVGTDATHFSPEKTLSTHHIVTFLYRALNPGQGGPNGGWDGEAEAWARQNDPNHTNLPFGVNIAIKDEVPCPRADVVTFLYEALT